FQRPKTVAEFDFASAPMLDLILLPGGFGTIPQLENPAMLDFLRRRAATAEVTMSVCSGSAILAKAGLLDGRRATSNKQFFVLARAQGAAVNWVEQARWVEDGPFATSSGVSAGTDMALGVIAKLYGKEIAQQIAESTEYEWQQDSTRDPFVRLLNKGDVGEVLRRMGRGYVFSARLSRFGRVRTTHLHFCFSQNSRLLARSHSVQRERATGVEPATSTLGNPEVEGARPRVAGCGR